jgi:hypothetical protein
MIDDFETVKGAKQMSLEPISSDALLAQRTRNCSILVVNLHQEITEDKKDFP